MMLSTCTDLFGNNMGSISPGSTDFVSIDIVQLFYLSKVRDLNRFSEEQVEVRPLLLHMYK